MRGATANIAKTIFVNLYDLSRSRGSIINIWCIVPLVRVMILRYSCDFAVRTSQGFSDRLTFAPFTTVMVPQAGKWVCSQNVRSFDHIDYPNNKTVNYPFPGPWSHRVLLAAFYIGRHPAGTQKPNTAPAAHNWHIVWQSAAIAFFRQHPPYSHRM